MIQTLLGMGAPLIGLLAPRLGSWGLAEVAIVPPKSVTTVGLLARYSFLLSQTILLECGAHES